jgi:hypothetical protein
VAGDNNEAFCVPDDNNLASVVIAKPGAIIDDCYYLSFQRMISQ